MTASSPARRAALSWAKGRELPPQRLWKLLRAAGSLEALLEAPEAELVKGLGSANRAQAFLRSPDDREAERWADAHEEKGARLVTAFDSEYPSALS
jgi:predicted Rossmann fold nucleotide-binding protein DprA/Smf involved in DNA uptake